MVSSITARVNFSRSISSAPLTVAPLTSAASSSCVAGIERQQIERPEQRGRGGLVAGEDHGRDLIAELFVGEGARRFRDRARRPSGRTGRAAARPRSCRRRGARPSAWRRNASSACGSGRGRNPAGSASPAAAADRENAAAPAARHTPSRSRATPRRGAPSRTRTWCARRSPASSAASPRAESTGASLAACSLAIVSSMAAIMCGTSVVTARGVKAGASVRRWCFQARPSAISRPSPSIGRSTRMPAGVRV